MATETVLVTGATNGIGKEIALKLVAQGKNVYVTGRDQGRLNGLVGELNGRRQRPEQTIGSFLFDIGQPSKIKEIMTNICKIHFDTVIFNAGVMFPTPRRPFDEDDLPWMEDTLKTNVVGHYLMARHLIANQQEPIRFVCLSSITAETANGHKRWKISPEEVVDFFARSRFFTDGWWSYFDSKLAVLVMAERLNNSGRDNVSAVAVHPGVANTNMVEAIPGYQRTILSFLPRPRFDSVGVCADNVIAASVSQDDFTNQWFCCDRLADFPSLSQGQKDSFMAFLGKVTDPFM